LFMQTLVLATQNSIARSDMGVGTSAITFFRTLGGAIGASVLGAILIAQERRHQAGDVARFGSKIGAQHAFTHGMTQAYLWALPVAFVSFALSWWLKEYKLNQTVGAGTVAEASPKEIPVP
jgi:hypothetical protein